MNHPPAARLAKRVLLALGSVLLALASSACTEPAPEMLRIPFEARAFGVEPACDAPHRVGPRAEPLVLHDLRFFVHDVRLVMADGSVQRARLVPDGRHQTREVALLDFEDGTGACTQGSAGKNTELRIEAPRGGIRELRFAVGVPFAPNHANPALAEGPLTAGTLHWGWRAGYKFVRFEARLGERMHRLHLGSTRCEGSFAHVTSCGRPNRAEVALPAFRPGRRVRVSLDAFLGDGPDLDCMAAEDDAACAPHFAALGLDPSSGRSIAPASLFTWSEP